jgi:DNA-binding GntR family transcriptional regulator
MIAKLTDDLLIHVRAIRQMTIRDEHRAERSIRDHMAIIEALERRDTERAEALCREHTLGLARHVEEHGDFLD